MKNFSKSIYTKDFKWYLSVEKFPKTAKDGDSFCDKVYHTGFHHWVSDFGSSQNFSIVLGCFRILLSTPTRKTVGYVCGEKENK